MGGTSPHEWAERATSVPHEPQANEEEGRHQPPRAGGEGSIGAPRITSGWRGAGEKEGQRGANKEKGGGPRVSGEGGKARGR